MLPKGEGCVREESRKIDIELFRMKGKVSVGGVKGEGRAATGGGRTTKSVAVGL